MQPVSLSPGRTYGLLFGSARNPPPYSPELHPVEHIWDEVREQYFGNLVFDSLDALEDHLETALRSMELDQPRLKSIVSWSWIINSLLF